MTRWAECAIIEHLSIMCSVKDIPDEFIYQSGRYKGSLIQKPLQTGRTDLRRHDPHPTVPGLVLESVSLMKVSAMRYGRKKKNVVRREKWVIGPLPRRQKKPYANCKNCGAPLPADRHAGRKYCDPECREAFGKKMWSVKYAEAHSILRRGRSATRRAAFVERNLKCINCYNGISSGKIQEVRKFCGPACKKEYFSARKLGRIGRLIKNLILETEKIEKSLASAGRKAAAAIKNREEKEKKERNSQKRKQEAFEACSCKVCGRSATGCPPKFWSENRNAWACSPECTKKHTAKLKRAERIRWRKTPGGRASRAASKARRKAVKRDALLPSSDMQQISAFYLRRDEAIQKTGIPHDVDHIIALSIGGAHHQDNLRVVPSSVNALKGNSYIPSLGGIWANNALAKSTKQALLHENN